MRSFFFLCLFVACLLLLLSPLVSAAYPGILAYGRANETTPFYRLWNGTGFGSAINTSTSVGGVIEWLRVASNPIHDEHIIVTADTGDDVNILIDSNLLGNACWHNGTSCNSSLELTSSSTSINRLKADVAYEQLSGDALVVYSDNSFMPRYRLWNGTSWSTQGSVPQTLIGGGVVSYVKLASKPLSDEIALIMTNTSALNIMIWNGTNWTCEPSSLRGTSLTPDVFQHADVAYEQLSGDLFVISSIDGGTEINYTIKSSGSCTYTTGQTTTLAEESEEVVLNSRVKSDYIIISQRDITGDDMQAIVWNGTAMRATSGNEVSLYAEVSPDILMATSWVGTSNFGLVIYSDAATSLNLDYFRYNVSTNAWAGGNTGLDATGITSFSDEEQNIFAYSFLDENKSLVFVQDDLDDLWVKIFDGDAFAWSDADGGIALEVDHSSTSFPSFDFDWVSYRADSINPSVTVLLPPYGSFYNSSTLVQIAANVSDNIAVSSVRAEITLPNGSLDSLTLVISSGAKYNVSYAVPLAGRYDVRIVANDSSNNLNSSETTRFYIDTNFTYFLNGSLSAFGYGLGWLNNIFYNTSLTLDNASSGSYLSPIIDAGNLSIWDNISWVQGGPYGVALPDNGGSESLWLRGNANMSGNILLLHFDEDEGTGFVDSSGLGHVVTAQEVGYNESGIFGTSFSFNPPLSNISVPFSTVLNPRAALTYEAWINWRGDANQDFDLQNIITNGDPDRALRVTEPEHFNGGRQAFAYIRVGGSLKQVYSTTQLSPSYWYHIVAVYNGTTVALYVNGQLEASASASGQVVSGTDNTYIGYEGVVDHFNGTIDEIAIYNRSLNASEILDHYMRGALRLNFSVRSCDDSACIGESFVDINDSSPQNLSVAQNRYFQYNVSFSTLNTSYSPELYNVSLAAVSFVGDAIPPALNLTSPLNVTYSSVQTLLNYTVGDANLQTCWYSTNSGTTNTTIICGVNVTGLNSGQGTSIWTVYANDSAGNTNMSRVTFSVDSLVPQVSFGAGTAANASIVSRSWVYVNISASDANEQAVTFALSNASTLMNRTIFSAGTRTINWTSLADGTYYYNVSVNDSLGNTNWTETRTITLDTGIPSGFYVAPTKESGINLARSFIEINVTASDQHLDSIVTRVYNSTHGLISQSVNRSSPAYVNLSGLGNGIYYYNASVNDSAGNFFELSTLNITLDTLAPLISLVYPSNTTYTSVQTALNYTVFDTNVQACWYSTDNGVTNITITCGTNVTGLTSAQGTNRWLVGVNDSAGNVNSSRVTFSVDSLAPGISFVAPTEANGSILARSFILINVTGSDTNFDRLTVRLFNASHNVLFANLSSSSPFFINYSGLSDGTYYFNAIVNDTFGNLNTTETRTVLVDSTVPAVFGVVPLAGATVSLGSFVEIGVNASDGSSISSVIALIVYPNLSLVNLSLALVTGQKYNATFVVPYLSGRYNVSFYANDSLNNVNTTVTTYFVAVDGVAPTYSNLSQTPSSPTSYVPWGNYTFNITWGDDVAVSTALLEFNSINYTMALQGSSVYSITLSNLAAGNYSYRYLANDSSNNWNTTGSEQYVIIKASADLSFLVNSTAENISFVYGGSVNASVRSSTNGVQLYRNGINVTSENHLFVTLAGGQYNYTATALENQNYSLLNLTRSVFISPAIGAATLLLNGSASNQTGVYGILTNASASTPYGVVTLYRDGVDVTGTNHHLIQLASGNYNWTAFSSGNENYSSSSITLWSYIARAQGEVTFLLNGSAENITISYPGQVNASATSTTGGVQLYRNGLNVTNENHQFVGLAVGQYNYTAFALESQNYTDVSMLLRATITGVVPDLNISITPSSNVVYPAATTVSGTGCVGELTCVLYRNGGSVSNPDSVTLGAGTYVYVYNTTGNENYSAASFSRALIVNQSTGLVYAYVNHTRTNMALELGQSISLNATLVNGSGSIALLLNGATINNGSSPLSNLTLFSNQGLFNVTASYAGNENYSASSETWFVSVVPDASAPSFSSFVEDPNNATSYVTGQSYRFNVTVTENYALDRVGIAFNGINYSVRNVSTVFTFNVTDLAAGTYSYYWWANDTGGNYNTSETRYYTVVPALGSAGLLLNGLASNLSVSYLVPTNLSATTPYGSVTLLLDGTDITSQNHLNVTRGAGFYNVTSFSSGDQNHSSVNVTYWLNITQLASNVSLFLNHTRANISIIRGTLLPINGSITTGENGLSVWVDSTLIYSGTSPSYNLTNFTSLGLINVSAFYAQSQNYSASSETWFVSVTYPPLLELVCEAGGPYQSNATVVSVGNVTFQGAALSSQLVVLDLRNTTSSVYARNVTSANDGGFEGIFELVPVGLYVFNASSSYLGQNVSCLDSVQVGGPAQLVLDKTANLYSISNDTIVYNISLRVLNVGASSALAVNLSDANSSESPYNVGTLTAGSYTDRSYLLNFTRGSTDSFALLSQAFAHGVDSYSGAPLQVNSTILNISIPGFSVGKHVTLIKNIVYVGETSRNVTYNVSTLLYNSGEEDLVNLVYLDTDINSTSFVINLSRASSTIYSGLVIIAKAASNQQYTFALATATIDALTFYGNQPVVTIPGYGGPADSLVYAPVRVAPSASFDTVIEVRNMNPDIGQDFQVDYWITSNDESVNFSSGAQTIYVPASGSTNTTVNLVAPATPATYRLRALVSWVGGTATAFDSFEVASEDNGGGDDSGGGGGGGSTPPTTGAAVIRHVLPSEDDFSPEEVICTLPYIRYGRECCLDRNGNSICDRDEISAEAPRRGFFTGLFTFNIDRIVVVRFIDNLLILLVSLAIVLFCIITITRLIRRRRRDTTRLTHLMGAEVYTQHGVHIGKLIDINLENYSIHSIVVELRAKHRNKHKGIVVPYQFVKGVKDVVLIDESVLKQIG